MAFRKISDAHIAFFLPELQFGGVERVVLNVSSGLASRVSKVDLVLAKADGPYIEQVDQHVKLVDLDSTRVMTSLGRLVQYLKRERPEILISSKDYASIVSIWAVRLARTKTRVIVTSHGMPSREMTEASCTRARIMPHLMHYFYRYADSIVAVSDALATDFAKVTRIPKERITVVYNPIINQQYKESLEDQVDHPWLKAGEPPVIIGAGRLVKEKGFDFLLESFALVLKRCKCRLMILGEGPERNSLESLVTRLGIEDDISLEGFVSNPVSYISKARIFALSSMWESLPTVVIEALAANTPVVAMDCPGGIREILLDGKYGTLVQERDPASYADALIEELLHDKKTLPQEAWQSFTLDEVIDRYSSLLESLL